MPHPFTCRNRSAEGHQWRWDDLGTLVPTAKGFVCPDCDFRQDWAHQAMTDPDLATIGIEFFAVDQPAPPTRHEEEE